jgi:S1-C subfamily serine protease
MKSKIKGSLILIAVLIIVASSAVGGIVADRYFNLNILDSIVGRSGNLVGQTQRIVNEESVVIDVADKASPSVVTVSIQTPKRTVFNFSPFGGFQQRVEGGTPQDIGTGFVISKDGLIITNKHVVSSEGSYKVVTQDDKEYDVKQISRDPSNDIAVLKIDATDLKPVELGDSSNLKVGQTVIAIGTALGEFRHTVTTGVISGLGRGITAGSIYEGYVEKLDDVIQTDAAINAGNSGGPLLNSAGQVIGINVAVASGAQNIGFAIPVNVVRSALDEFNKSGKFTAKAYLGVEYQMVSKQSAVLNDIPQGAYVVNVVVDSPAEKAGIKVDDIIVKIGNDKVADQTNGLSDVIKKYKPGDEIELEIWRDNESVKIKATLSEYQG